MEVETLLPLGKVDPGLRKPGTSFDISRTVEDARLVESLGYDGLMCEETKQDPYIVTALAAQATTKTKIGTAVAIAFPRSPAVTAMSAWNVQKLSRGRFILGLGTQVKGHIERRFGFEWSPPGPWMREYIGAIRALWHAWQSGGQPRFYGKHYQITLTVPLFDPGPIDYPSIPIHLAAVNPYMCRVAGEVADGVRPHPVCTAQYIKEVMLPAVRAGAVRAQRTIGGFAICIKPLIATARDEETLSRRIDDVRARIAFYASTPAYRAAFAAHGLGELADELKHLSRAQRWDEMQKFISDDILHTYACVGKFEEIATKISDRYGSLVTNVEFSIPVQKDEDVETLKTILSELKAA